MKAEIARAKSFNYSVKTLVKNAIKQINEACKSGDIHTRCTTVDDYKISTAFDTELKKLGYRLGSTEGGKPIVRNVFWDEPKLNKKDFINK